MRGVVSKHTTFFLLWIILLAWAAILPPSLCNAGMQELSESEMGAVYAYGFSTFSLTDGVARVDFNNVTLSTWTEISSMKLGYYANGATTAWDNDWTSVSLGSSGGDLVAHGLYIEAKFSNIADPATRQLEYVRIGTTSLTGTISANFTSFSGTLDGGLTSFSRANLGTTSISSSGAGFYLSLERSGSKMGYTFNWINATTP
jgi:hypothetical protein